MSNPMRAEPSTLIDQGKAQQYLRSPQFLGPVAAIGGVALIAAMDGPIAVFALPRIQSELGLSDAGRTWVITAYMLTFGGLILPSGRLGDAIGRKRAFIIGVVLFTCASALCGVAWNGGVLVLARLLHGVAAAIVTPTCMALVATTFPKGPARNAVTAVMGAMASLGAVLGLVLGGMLTGVSWRLAFLVNVPVGLLLIYLAATRLRETPRQRIRLDLAGATLATLVCGVVVFGLSMAPEKGWSSPTTMCSALVIAASMLAFVVIERKAKDPIVPLGLFLDRDRLATFTAMFLIRGVGFTLTVVIALYVQNIMGYTPLQAGISFVPFTIAIAIGTIVSSRLVVLFAPRVVMILGGLLVLGSLIYGSTLDGTVPYFPNLLLPISIGAFGLGFVNVPLGLSLIASVGTDRIGPTSAIAVMLQTLGGPLILAVIQVAISMRTRALGGTTGPTASLSVPQLHALEVGYNYGMFWLAGISMLFCVAALFIGYTADQVARAQDAQTARDDEAGDETAAER